MHATFASTLAVVLSATSVATAAAQGLAFSRMDYASTPGARAIVVEDFNRDGWPDLAHAGLDSTDLSILLNDRGGGPAQAFTVPVGVGPFDIATGDIDRDGIPDLAVANADSGSISLLFGRGDGRFDRSDISSSATQTSLRGIALADVNGDGTLDLIYTGYTSNRVAVQIGDGTGRFALVQNLIVNGHAPRPQGVRPGDFDRDGHLDLAVAYDAPANQQGGLSIWYGRGDGTFAPVAMPGASYLNVLAVGDLNGDGRLDVAGASTNLGRVAIYFGADSGLAFQRSYFVDTDPRGIAIADVDADGAPDVITASRTSSTVNVLRGDPSRPGSFLGRLSIAAGVGSRAVAVADFDADGRLDLATGNQYAAAVSILSNVTPVLPAAFSFGRRTIPSGVDLSGRHSDNEGRGFWAADVDRNGTLDFIQREADSPAGWATGAVAVVRPDLDTLLLAGPEGYNGHIVADADGDSNPDVVITGSSELLTYLNDGSGYITRPIVSPFGAEGCVPGDMNRDGRLDLVCVGRVMLGAGNGAFTPGAAFSSTMDGASIPGNLQIADLNRDGKLDVVSPWEIWLGDGMGNLTPGGIVGDVFGMFSRVLVADLNHDAYPDLLLNADAQALLLALGSAAGYRQVTWIHDDGLWAGIDYAVADVNVDGHPDVIINFRGEGGDGADILKILPGRGDGTFGPPELFGLAGGEVLVADITRDGLPDIVVSGMGAIHVLENTRIAANHPPVVAVSDLNVAYPGCFALAVEASDPDQHALFVEWQVDGPAPAGSPLPGDGLMARLTSATACVDVPGVYTYELTVRDGRGAAATGTMTVTVPPPTEIVLHMNEVTISGTGEWTIEQDPSGAGNVRAYNRNAGAAKVNKPLAQPASFVELSFIPDPSAAYKLWLRLKADGDHWGNDSVWVQFSGSTDAQGRPVYRIGTTSGLPINLEECVHCGSSGWGWEDDGWGAPDRNGVLLRFPEGGQQRMRIQTREDGVSVDQVVLSSTTYRSTRPGAARDDTTILKPSARGPAFEVLVDFWCETIGCAPNTALMQASDGFIYGTTSEGNTSGISGGSIFRTDHTRLLRVTAPPGWLPSRLIEASDGYLYGTTYESLSTAYRMDAAGTVTVLHEFTAFPTSLIQARDGFFYGTTYGGGAFGQGTVYRMDRSGAVTVVHSFDGVSGAGPAAAIVEAHDGSLYGTTVRGGVHDQGVVFRISWGPQ